MTLTDDIARQMLAAQVGALRQGSVVYNQIAGEIDDLEERIGSRIRRGRGVVRITQTSGRKIADMLEAAVDEYADQRIEYLMKMLRRQGVEGLRSPRDAGSLRFERGDVAKFMDKATENAAERADNLEEEDDPEDATRGLRANIRAVTRSGVNAAHNAAVLAVARANPKAIQGVLALATLDNRTTEICINRHGGSWDLATREPLAWSASQEEFPGRPPWHFNCRTTLTPVFVGDDQPSEDTLDREAWFDTVEAQQAFGEKLNLFKQGKISRVRLVNEGLL